MAIIPADEKVFMVSNNTNTIYGGSAALQAMNKWYTMQDISDSVVVTAPYKVYSALLNQSGTSDPTAMVNENTIGTFTLTRNSTGIYYLTSPAFNGYPDYGKVLVFLTNGLINRSITGAYTPPINGVTITTADLAGITTDGYINNCSIEIRLYN
jgi:hypothetical protein